MRPADRRNWARGAASFPEAVHDAASGIASVSLHQASRFASFGADTTRLVLCGNSSGGHLMTLIAFDQQWLEALGVPLGHIRACVDVSGVASFGAPLLFPARLLLLVCLLCCDAAAARALSPLEHITAGTAGKHDAQQRLPFFYIYP